MDEIEIGAVGDAVEYRRRPGDLDAVPSHVGYLHRAPEPDDPALDNGHAGDAGRLLGRFEEDLHAEADAEIGLAGRYLLP